LTEKFKEMMNDAKSMAEKGNDADPDNGDQ
jgi:hypothetical protein